MHALLTSLLLALTVTTGQVAADCWKTDACQLNSWNSNVCANNGRVETARTPCTGGNNEPGFIVTCCTGNPPSGTGRVGVTTRYWDCCKPSCSWPNKAPVGAPIRTCAANGIDAVSPNAVSACDQGGYSYVCNNQQPFVNEATGVAYGWVAAGVAGQSEWDSCCACYKVTFTSGPVAGKVMIVQISNTGADLGSNHFDIQIPGGGVGIFNACSKQWGAPNDGWGARYGGVSSLEACNQLPKQLQEGCKWRFGWFKGADNPSMSFTPVTCPVELTSKSGCTRK